MRAVSGSGELKMGKNWKKSSRRMTLILGNISKFYHLNPRNSWCAPSCVLCRAEVGTS